MKEEALKLADEQAEIGECYTALIIRRLVEELDKEKAKSGNLANSDFDTVYTKTALGESLTQTKPLKLSYEQINQVASRFSLNGFSYIDFAEAILEEASK